MAIKRLYQKLADNHNDFGFDSDTSSERRRELHEKGQRLQFIVYSALFAFIVLAAYGYFLIYNLTHDVHSISRQMGQMTITFQRMTSSVESNMDIMSLNIQSMARTVGTTLPVMSNDTTQLDTNTKAMAHTIANLNNEIKKVSKNLTLMTNATVNMQRDLWSMNKNVSDPVGTMMNNMTPWGGGNKVLGSPGPLPYRPLPAR
jgi:methyl-accepting chemotaxis protein